MVKNKTFKRGGYRHDRIDTTGKVVIKIMRCDKAHQPVKGNLFRSIIVQESSVSEVSAAIERALFGEGK